MKAVLIEIGVCEFSNPSSKPFTKPNLSSTKPKKYNLETINKRLERAAIMREAMLQIREEKLQSLAKERIDKIRRKESCNEVVKQEMVAKLVLEHEEAEKRRTQRQKEMVEKLQERHKKVSEVATTVTQRKGEETFTLKMKILEKLEDYEQQREKNKEQRVKKLESYHFKLAKAVQTKKAKEEKKVIETANIIEKKQLQAKENREKHIQRIRMLAEEVVDKVKKIQEFVYESECI